MTKEYNKMKNYNIDPDLYRAIEIWGHRKGWHNVNEALTALIASDPEIDLILDRIMTNEE